MTALDKNSAVGTPSTTLAADLDRVTLQVARRAILTVAAAAMLGGAGTALAQRRPRPRPSPSPSPAPSPAPTPSPSACPTINDETAGPFPADGTNGVNALITSGIVRNDIRSSFGGAVGTAAGVPMTVVLRLVNSSASCAVLAGRAIYLWHADREGRYSLYSAGVTQQNYLRGVAVTDANGEVRFTTIVPGCYQGRWPHMHFEVYASLDTAISGSFSAKTSQLALPAAACQQVYGSVAGYESSASNFARISLESDGIFGDDGAAYQMASVTGSAAEGYVATLQVGIASG